MSKQVTFDTIRKVALELPGVEEGTAYGAPAFKIRGKLLACIPTHKSAEPGSLVVRIDADDRAELIAAEPDTYYIQDHYKGYTCVLVRLSRIKPEALRDLLRGALRFVTRKQDPLRRPGSGTSTIRRHTASPGEQNPGNRPRRRHPGKEGT